MRSTNVASPPFAIQLHHSHVACKAEMPKRMVLFVSSACLYGQKYTWNDVRTRVCFASRTGSNLFVGIFSIVGCGTSQICIRLSDDQSKIWNMGPWDRGSRELYIKQPNLPPLHGRVIRLSHLLPTYHLRFIYTIIMGWFDDNHDYTQAYNDVCFSFFPFATSAAATFIVIVFSTKVAPSTSRVSPTRSLLVLRPMRFVPVPVAPKFSCNIQ